MWSLLNSVGMKCFMYQFTVQKNKKVGMKKTAALIHSVLAGYPASATLLTMRFNQKKCVWLNFVTSCIILQAIAKQN